MSLKLPSYKSDAWDKVVKCKISLRVLKLNQFRTCKSFGFFDGEKKEKKTLNSLKLTELTFQDSIQIQTHGKVLFLSHQQYIGKLGWEYLSVGLKQ